MYPFIRPFLFALPAELAHHVTLPVLHTAHRLKLTKLLFGNVPDTPCTVMGLRFPNRVGLAAGMDKNGEYIESFSALGFGFIEVGTVTPRPQPGNPPPRLFRLPMAQALINRLGFNNQGVDKLIENVKRSHHKSLIGINIGKNADTPIEEAVDDYLICLYKVYPYADYITVNISSPNTPSLRQLQFGAELERMLERLKRAQAQLATEYIKYVPLVIKISPDLSDVEVMGIARTLLDYEIDGVVATNTTVSRADVDNNLPFAYETGGLSGAPLLARSTEIVRQLNVLLQGKIPIIGSGGVMSAAAAREKFQAGASLVQVYTGLIYRGPALVREIVELEQHSAIEYPV